MTTIAIDTVEDSRSMVLVWFVAGLVVVLCVWLVAMSVKVLITLLGNRGIIMTLPNESGLVGP